MAILGGLGLLTGLAPPVHGDGTATEQIVNPRLGNPEAIEEGRRFYRTRCVICHGRSGGRGPNLFATRLGDAAFLVAVTKGRGAMPAMGVRMNANQIWAVHAYVRSTDHHE